MSIVEIRGGQLTPAKLCKKYSKDELARELLSSLDRHARLVEQINAVFPDAMPRWMEMWSVPDDVLGKSRVRAHLFDGERVHHDCTRDVLKGEWWSQVDGSGRAYRVPHPTHWFPMARIPSPPRSERGCTSDSQE